IGFAAALFIVLFFLFKSKKNFVIAMLTISLLGYGTINSKFLENNRYIKRIVSITNADATSPKIRIFLWESSIDMFKNNLPFGVGRDNAGKYALEYMEKNKKYDEMKWQWAKLELKNIAGSGNLTVGVIGTGKIGFAAALFIVLFFLFKSKKNFVIAMLTISLLGYGTI
ncbi:O-antigen ligase family protein, partial [Fusobacterium mortiferum]|uniref:O-antigen ligase family protein n=1 Tax=Fusobacterium mortiferum TaxID=850 RepID=UPI001959C132|nr:O-antigen ligase family protein [Fusobacterium mortiferum]